MNLIYNITFKVLSDTFFSKLTYIFNRALIRIGNKFLLFFFIALILAVLITFFYYKYISRLLKLEERRVLEVLKRVFRPIFRKKKKSLTEHEIFTKRQLKKKEERKKSLDIFKGKESKKTDVSAEEVKKMEGVEEDGYIMWPPKPKEKEEKIFDQLPKSK